jgi:mannose-1-phosphate guanylyltransferase
MAMQVDSATKAAVILAGGEGLRLSSFTREIFGHHLPKQFCPLFDGNTLLEETRHRVALLIPPSQTIIVLNRAHERFYSQSLEGTGAGNVLIQPVNRGTATAILSALVRLIEAGHKGAVAIFPSDHYVSDDSTFMHHVAKAFRAVERSSRQIVLLGIKPSGPETEYGWIEASGPIADAHPFDQISRIRCFWEKPSPAVASELYDRGCLWNSFIVVANATALLSLIAAAVPELYLALSRIRSVFGTAAEEDALRTIYRDLRAADFSRSVLAQFPTELAVLPVTGVNWSDLGDPQRLLAVLYARGRDTSGGHLTAVGVQHLAFPSSQEEQITRNQPARSHR